MPSLDRLHRPVLVLNASYEPINICAARRALVALGGTADKGRPIGNGFLAFRDGKVLPRRQNRRSGADRAHGRHVDVFGGERDESAG